MSHASIPSEVRAARGLPDDLVRISCGIEDADDLLADLQYAFAVAEKRLGDAGTVPKAVKRQTREEELLARIAALESRLDGQQ